MPRSITLIPAALVAVMVAQPALARNDDIVFMPGRDCSGFPRFSADSEARQKFNCTYGSGCKNDAYKSVWIAPSVKPGTVIKVWDDSKGSGKDDWAVITVRAGGICVPSFEMSSSGPTYAIAYHRVDNLNGKVSLIEITPAR